MFELIETLIKLVFFSFFLYGLWLSIGSSLLQAEIESSILNWKRKRKIKRLRELNNVKKEEKEKSRIYQHIELILGSLSKSNKYNVLNFILLTCIIFLVTFFCIITLIGDFIITLVISVVFASMPYIIARFKLTSLRMKTQLAFLNEYHNLVQNYHATNNDIYYTILNVVKDTRDKDLKIIYTKLFSSLQKDRNKIDFIKAVNLFSFSINSTFSKRFAKLLLKANLDQVDISLSLMDMNVDIKKRKQDMQTEKTKKIETIIMGYLPLILFPLMIFTAYRFSNLHSFWYYFQEKTTITLFIIALICTIISVLSAFIASKPKADI